MRSRSGSGCSTIRRSRPPCARMTPPTSTWPAGPSTTSSRRGRSAPPASITFSAAISTASPKNERSGPTWACTASRSTTTSSATWRRSNGSTTFARRPSAKGFRYFLEVFDPNIPGAVKPENLPRYINDMITRMLAGRRPGRPAAVPEDGLPRAEGDGRTRPVRSPTGCRHPGRLCRHDPRRVPAPPRCPEIRSQGGPVRAQDQQRRESTGVRAFSPADRRGKSARRRRSRPTMRCSASWEFDQTGRSKTTFNLTDQAMSYAGGSRGERAQKRECGGQACACACSSHEATEKTARPNGVSARCGCSARRVTESKPAAGRVTASQQPARTPFSANGNGHPDFARMSPAERLAYHRERLGLVLIPGGRSFMLLLDFRASAGKGKPERRSAPPGNSAMVRLLAHRVISLLDHSFRLRAIAWAAGFAVRAGARIRQGELHQVRVPHSDARRRASLHLGVRSQGSIGHVSDHAFAHAVRGPTLRHRRVQDRPGAIAFFWQGRLHRGLPGRARALDVGGRVRQYAALPSAEEHPARHR